MLVILSAQLSTMLERVARPLTLIVSVPDEVVAASTRHMILEKLLVSLNPDDVCCVQFVPKRYARITFTTFAARQKAFESGISIDDHRLVVFEADPVRLEVFLEHLPYEVTDETVSDALGPFGTVHSSRFQNFAGTNIRTGTRVLEMSLISDVPVNLRVLRYPCRVSYRGQPRPCPICRANDHRVFSCPLRDLCRRCRQPGHYARNCTYVPESSDPSVCSGDADSCSTDGEPGDDELASGDEEVVNAVTVDTTLPRQTRSAVPDPPELGTVSPCSEPRSPSDFIVSPAPEPAAEPGLFRVPGRMFRAPLWIARLPPEYHDLLLDSGHSSDTHVLRENLRPPGREPVYVDCIFDFGQNTYKVIKDVTTFEEVRFRYHQDREDRLIDYQDRFPSKRVKKFPGAVAVTRPGLPADVMPLKFPGQ